MNPLTATVAPTPSGAVVAAALLAFGMGIRTRSSDG